MANDIKTKVIIETELDNKDYIKGLDKQEKAQEKSNKTTEEGVEVSQEMTGALDGMLGSIGLNTGALKGLKSGLTNSVKGFKSLKVAIASTGIGLLVIALGALFTWFNRSAEGQEKLRKGMAVFGAVIDVLMDSVAGLGESLFKLFSDPKKALEDFGELLKTAVQDKIAAVLDGVGLLGSAIKKVFEGDFTGALEDAKDGAIKLNNELNPTVIAINLIAEAGKEVVKVFEEIVDESGKALAIADKENQLFKDKLAFVTKEAELQVGIAEARQKSEDKVNLTNAERLEQSTKAIDLTKQLQAERKKILETELKLLLASNDLGLNDDAANQKVQELRRSIILLNKEQADALTGLGNQRAGLIAGIEAEVKAEQDKADALDKIQEDRTLKAEEKLIIAKEKKLEENALELDTAREQADALLMIEDERYKRELILAKDNKAELDLLNFEHQNTIDKINEEGNIKIDELNQLTLQQKKDSAKDETVALGGALAEQFGIGKEFAIAATLVNNAQGIAKTISNLGMPYAIPFIVGQGVLIAKQISDIKKAEKGMMIGGKRHSQGGTLVEAEQGELIMNRNSVSMFRQELSDISIAGGGIPFAQRGLAVEEASSRAITSNLSSDISSSLNNTRTVLVTEDLESVQSRVSVTENIATL
jgi:hypothetical protein